MGRSFQISITANNESITLGLEVRERNVYANRVLEYYCR